MANRIEEDGCFQRIEGEHRRRSKVSIWERRSEGSLMRKRKRKIRQPSTKSRVAITADKAGGELRAPMLHQHKESSKDERRIIRLHGVDIV